MLRIWHGFGVMAFVAFVLYSFWRAMDIRLMRAKSTFQFDIGPIPDHQQATASVATLSLVFFGLCAVLFFYTILHEKGSRRAFSFLSLVFSAGMMIWSFLMKESPSHISFDEVFPAWILVPVFFIVSSLMILYRRKTQLNSEEILDHDFR